ncbi:hypothetical protein [Kitasatospora mediocidica]|uniref:hypothetical protein n=1 Tax=Kitasatospora mediocidica TaxID=58352 RepID=UPI000A6716E2|nr:hypothetical protein [Kitasatospora mediocidica]
MHLTSPDLEDVLQHIWVAGPGTAQPGELLAGDATPLTRAQAQAAPAEILTQRTRIGKLLRRVRDLEAEWTQEAIQRITTENTTLKQRVRQLTADNRSFDERLKAARSNLRFQDRRVADLEAQIAAT